MTNQILDSEAVNDEVLEAASGGSSSSYTSKMTDLQSKKAAVSAVGSSSFDDKIREALVG